MTRTVLDLYCCQGGATRGYQNAGYKVVGVDLDDQPRYIGNEFWQSDAISFLTVHRDWILANVCLVHASPPCQFDSDCQRIQDNDHPDLIEPTREALEDLGLPYVIENVGGAIPKLGAPVMLCGAMFGLARTYRHRYFATGGWALTQPVHPEHTVRQVKLGRSARNGEAIQAIGNFAGVGIIRAEWDVPWMNRDGIREAIPPAYSEWIGRQFAEHLARVEVAA
ncbi:SAM-dependent methyltransferase [Streptomyces sp. NPDC052015]|uniref:SAM-dependent methyltransferase n=1 Tax=Streptomyces sp. NPDC052015 TaxID=3154755 RepID=UPI0034131079